MSTFELSDADNVLDDSRDLAVGSSLAEDKNRTSTMVTCKHVVSAHEIVKDRPAVLEIADSITADLVGNTQFEVEKSENLCGSETIEATNSTNEDDPPQVPLNYDRLFDTSHADLSYFNSRINTSDVCHDFEHADGKIREKDGNDSEKTIQEKFPVMDDKCANFFAGLELSENLDLTSCENLCRVNNHQDEKSIDSGISVNSVRDNHSKTVQQITDSYVDLLSEIENNGVACASYVKRVKKDREEIREETKFEENVGLTVSNIEHSPQEGLDINNMAASTIDCGNYYINNDENYLKDDIDLLKCTEESVKYPFSVASAEEEYGIEESITEIKEMNKIISNLLCTDDDKDQRDSVEERMANALSSNAENDDVMRKIIVDNCSDISVRQYSPICENANVDLRRSSSDHVIKKKGGKFCPRRRVASDTSIAKEDILKTIEEAEKILTNNPYAFTSQATENCNDDRLVDKSAKETTNDDERGTKTEEANYFIENKNAAILENERIETITASSEPDIVESNLQKLAEITCYNRPRSHAEIYETLKKIAEEKRKIEDRKNESLEGLSKKFEEIDKLVADRTDNSRASDDPCGLMFSDNVDSDSLDEFQIDPENLELPLTKSEITENLKIEELEKELANEIKEHNKLMDEYEKILTTELEELQEETLKKESVRDNEDKDVDEECEDKSEIDRKMNEQLPNETSEVTTDVTATDIDSESDDSVFEELKKPERTYITGKIYDFDEKRHGVRMTEELIRKHCKEKSLYLTPYLNDVLYLHYKGFSFIENLEKYTGLKCLWLESNGIREIANLENQSELKCLYLHHNLIDKIENLDYQTKLDTLNLSHNTIRKIENLDGLKFLTNLNLSHNYLQETADIEHLRLLHAISILDISHNRIDTCDVVDILGDMKSLRVLCLTGNPVLKVIKMYRKTMILKCKDLQYLDDRPVFPRDRACAEAW
ncbi:uncharacterized protein LOC109856264 [Pseudomyrmex gracilis]|uniref:uncharacterized protein LOC109856264 n=1 Tax=Pseudomyrmex gracilis TaxID=219809 RepID=UPI0009949FFA|nr:uncharacterized protein LOC109856264 [Pseudomyrmex gracilis]